MSHDPCAQVFFWHISMPISQLKWYMMVCWISIYKYICLFKMTVYTWYGSKKYLESHRSFYEIKVSRDICRFLRWLSNKILVKNSREIADALMRNQKGIDPILWLCKCDKKQISLFIWDKYKLSILIVWIEDRNQCL